MDSILEEIEFLVEEFGTKELQILDDNFSFSWDHAYAVSQGILDRHLVLSWTLPNGIRADRVDKVLLRKMKEAGCYYFGIGIESGSSRMLEIIGKNLSLEDVKRTTRDASRLGYITQGFFMVGHPEETSEDRKATQRFARSLPIDRASLLPMIPFPGTGLFRDYCENGLDPSVVDWTKMHWLGFVPRTITKKGLRSYLRWFYLGFYLNPVRLFRHLTKIRTFSEVKGLFKGLIVLLRVAK